MAKDGVGKGVRPPLLLHHQRAGLDPVNLNRRDAGGLFEFILWRGRVFGRTRKDLPPQLDLGVLKYDAAEGGNPPSEARCKDQVTVAGFDRRLALDLGGGEGGRYKTKK